MRRPLRALACGALLAGIPAAASATPCEFAPLTTYMAAGYSCTLGGGTLSRFALSSSATGAGATALTASEIYVDPFDGGVGDGWILQYESPSYTGLGTGLWETGPGQQLNFTISYSLAYEPNDYPVAFVDDYPLSASQDLLNSGSVNQPFLTGDGEAKVLDEASNAVAGFSNSELLEECGPLVTSCRANGGGAFNLQPGDVPTLSDLFISSEFTIDGGQSGSADVLGLSTAVVENTSTVPEPTTLVLFGMGLVGLGLINRTRLTNRKFGIGI
jgi:hypothetical protein